jgi:hypothetical protein
MIINIETFLILGGTKQDLKREVICQCWATGGQRQMAARTPAWAWGAHHRAAAGGANHDSVPRGACHRAHATVPCVRCPTGPASGARTRPASLGVGPSPRRRLAKIACSPSVVPLSHIHPSKVQTLPWKTLRGCFFVLSSSPWNYGFPKFISLFKPCLVPKNFLFVPSY